MKLVPIAPEHLPRAWPVIAPYAEQMAAAWPDDWPVPEIARAAAASELLLWVVWDEEAKQSLAVVGTSVIRKPSGRRFLDVSLAAGHNHERWVHLIPLLEEHGRRQGCAAVSVSGRMGWAKALPGYRLHRSAVMTKELGDGQEGQPADADGPADREQDRPGARTLP